jgi:hypothetical protein
MIVRPSKCLAVLMVLSLLGLSVAPVWALCAAPCCKGGPTVTAPAKSASCHEQPANETPVSEPPCLLKGFNPSDLAARGPTSELRINHLLVAHYALASVEVSASSRVVEVSALGTGPPILHPLRPIYILSLSLLC